MKVNYIAFQLIKSCNRRFAVAIAYNDYINIYYNSVAFIKWQLLCIAEVHLA